jgi:hypothetical protein
MPCQSSKPGSPVGATNGLISCVCRLLSNLRTWQIHPQATEFQDGMLLSLGNIRCRRETASVCSRPGEQIRGPKSAMRRQRHGSADPLQEGLVPGALRESMASAASQNAADAGPLHALPRGFPKEHPSFSGRMPCCCPGENGFSQLCTCSFGSSRPYRFIFLYSVVRLILRTSAVDWRFQLFARKAISMIRFSGSSRARLRDTGL